MEYHQGRYLANIEGLKFGRMVFRGLTCTFSARVMRDATGLSPAHEIYHPDDYELIISNGQVVSRNKVVTM